jgi:hypothetical protein
MGNRLTNTTVAHPEEAAKQPSRSTHDCLAAIPSPSIFRTLSAAPHRATRRSRYVGFDRDRNGKISFRDWAIPNLVTTFAGSEKAASSLQKQALKVAIEIGH